MDPAAHTTMTDDTLDPILEIAYDYGSSAAPLGVTGEPDFEAFCAVADELAGEIERSIRSEVPA
jgi:hypothetical protein